MLVVTGKGGVGKSAVAAAIALEAVRRGKHVLAVGMVDGGGLAAHFGLDALPYDPVEVRPGLQAMAIDRAAAIDEYLKLQVHVPRSVPTKPLSSVFGAVVDTIPGVREVVTIGKPIYDVWTKAWDLVVVDGAPLGQISSYLDAPRTIEDLVPAGRIRDQAGQIAATLRQESSAGLVMVVIPEELPVNETMLALAQLETTATIPVAAVLANRVLEPLDIAAVDGVPAGPHREAAILHLGLHDAQQRWLGELPPGADELPYLFGMHTSAEVAARLADLFEDVP